MSAANAFSEIVAECTPHPGKHTDAYVHKGLRTLKGTVREDFKLSPSSSNCEIGVGIVAQGQCGLLLVRLSKEIKKKFFICGIL